MPALLTPPPLIAPNHALFLDFDGTLTPLGDNAYKSQLLPDIATALPLLNTYLKGALAIISGRDVRNLSERCPHTLVRIGTHGLEVCHANEPPHPKQDGPAALLPTLEAIVAPHTGVWVEDKGPVCAVHYRAAPHTGPELEVAMRAAINAFEGYSVQHGKHILEAKPKAAHKGRAMQAIMQHPIFAGRLPIMVGDDKTDEDAFTVAQNLGGFAIKVGEGQTLANYRLDHPNAVAAWLSATIGK